MFKLPEKIYLVMIEQARSAFPNEACGILGGLPARVEQIYPATNREASPVHFLLEPIEQLRIFQDMEEKGWQMLGTYHSHIKAAPYPSCEDIEMAHYPESLHLILSLRDWDHPEVGGFWIREGKVTEEGIEITSQGGEERSGNES